MKKLNNYAFIDSQNLNLGVRSLGWVIDYKKFRLYLRNKYSVEKAFLFIGHIPENKKLYNDLKSAGFILVFKPTVLYFEKGKESYKGNVDAELVLYAAAKMYSSYDKAIIVSGDGDFYCLVEYLVEQKKLAYVLVPNRKFSKLLRKFDKYIKRIDNAKESVEYKNDQHRRSVETLGQSGRGDTNKKTRTSGRYETLGIPGHDDTKRNIPTSTKKVNEKQIKKRSSRPSLHKDTKGKQK